MTQMKTNINEVLGLLERKLGVDYFWKKYRKPLPLVFSENFFLMETSSPYDHFVLIIPFDSNIDIDLVRGVYFYVKEKAVVFVENSALEKEIVNNGICYFDRLGQYHSKGEQSAIQKMSYTKITQLLVKYLLLSNSNLFSTRQVAEFFGISNASVKRAYDFLESIDAIEKRGSFTSTISYGIKSKKHLLDCAKKYFILPYKRSIKVFVNYGDLDTFAKDMFYSAEHVLSRVSDLSNPEDIELATSHKVFEKLLNTSDNKMRYADELVTVEEWIYKIDYFSITNEIDLVDAYIILCKRYENTVDTRISSALKQLEKAIIKENE